MELLKIATVLLGTMTATAYRSVPAQTDGSPYITSSGERCNPYGVAISQDLICPACLTLHHRCKHPEVRTKLHYKDFIYVEDVGLKYVNDLMNKRHKKHLDIWVPNLAQEKDFHSKFKNRTLKVWRVEVHNDTQVYKQY